MHFYYIDETGCNGRDLSQTQQPIFALGGIILRDEGWNKTHQEYEKIIDEYFEGSVPDNFELHTQYLFSDSSTGFFSGHTRERRNGLILKLLELIETRKHHAAYIAIDKAKLDSYDISTVREREYFDLKTPYLISYDYLISVYEKHTKEKLGRSARALVVLDEKDSLIEEIEAITSHRRFNPTKSKRVKWIVEFSHPVDSEKNTMIQLSDLIIFLIRKYLEIEGGYKEDYPVEIKEIYRDFYAKIHDRLIYKIIVTESGRNAQHYNNFINDISALPSVRWKTKNY